jgi:predicted Fe-Mo cluster-binding NifX family protein
MKAIALPMSRPDISEPLSEHLGKAKWLLVWREDGGHSFIRNEGLNGRWVAERLAQEGCTQLIAQRAGAGALEHLKAAQIRVYQADPGATAAELLALLLDGKLKEMTFPAPEHLPLGASCGKLH